MEFIYDFEMELVEEIIRQAVKQGFSIRIIKWVDEWEREEGCPSISYSITPEKYYKKYEGKEYLLIPDYEKHGCSELNFTKDNDYICCYHIEMSDEYICSESLDLINLDELEIWLEEETLELVNKDATKYLHGECQEWVKEHFKEGDKAVMILELDEEVGKNYLIHCCIKRGEEYLDVRGITPEFNDILEAYDYYNYEEIMFNNLEDFMKAINNLGINFK